jgi:hypothetical protein
MELTTTDVEVEVASPEDLRGAVDAALCELGLTLDELREQAERGRFSSERAWLTWFMIAEVA